MAELWFISFLGMVIEPRLVKCKELLISSYSYYSFYGLHVQLSIEQERDVHGMFIILGKHQVGGYQYVAPQIAAN
jgi:hypothetical protein